MDIFYIEKECWWSEAQPQDDRGGGGGGEEERTSLFIIYTEMPKAFVEQKWNVI